MYSRYLPNLPLFWQFFNFIPILTRLRDYRMKEAIPKQENWIFTLDMTASELFISSEENLAIHNGTNFHTNDHVMLLSSCPDLAHQPSEFPGGLNSRCTTPAQSLPKWAKNSNSHPFKGKIKATFIKLIRYLGEFPFVRTECYQNNASPGGNLPGTEGKLWAVVNYLLFIVISMYRQIPRRDLIICYSFSHFLLVNRQTSGLCVGCWWENGFPMFSMFNIFFSTELLN